MDEDEDDERMDNEYYQGLFGIFAIHIHCHSQSVFVALKMMWFFCDEFRFDALSTIATRSETGSSFVEERAEGGDVLMAYI